MKTILPCFVPVVHICCWVAFVITVFTLILPIKILSLIMLLWHMWICCVFDINGWSISSIPLIILPFGMLLESIMYDNWYIVVLYQQVQFSNARSQLYLALGYMSLLLKVSCMIRRNLSTFFPHKSLCLLINNALKLTCAKVSFCIHEHRLASCL